MYSERCRSVICHHFTKICNGEEKFAKELVSLSDAEPSSGALVRTMTMSLLSMIRKFAGERREGLEMVFGPFVCICARFSSQTRPSAIQGITSRQKSVTPAVRGLMIPGTFAVHASEVQITGFTPWPQRLSTLAVSMQPQFYPCYKK